MPTCPMYRVRNPLGCWWGDSGQHVPLDLEHERYDKNRWSGSTDTSTRGSAGRSCSGPHPAEGPATRCEAAAEEAHLGRVAPREVCRPPLAHEDRAIVGAVRPATRHDTARGRCRSAALASVASDALVVFVVGCAARGCASGTAAAMQGLCAGGVASTLGLCARGEFGGRTRQRIPLAAARFRLRFANVHATVGRVSWGDRGPLDWGIHVRKRVRRGQFSCSTPAGFLPSGSDSGLGHGVRRRKHVC
mmetsp:Transcript_999/g.2335  ORF Transcript_999/g.2335 Transcript_999/m.2335 type:complete len:247 (+) Transcript_999:615-1355(+)